MKSCLWLTGSKKFAKLTLTSTWLAPLTWRRALFRLTNNNPSPKNWRSYAFKWLLAVASTVYHTIKRGYTLCIAVDLFIIYISWFIVGRYIQVNISGRGGALAPSIDPPPLVGTLGKASMKVHCSMILLRSMWRSWLGLAPPSVIVGVIL